MPRARTRLTGADDSAPTSDSGSELYSAGLALPSEPTPRSRWRRPALVLAGLVLAVSALFGSYRLVTSGQDFDPALTDQPGSPAPEPAG